MKRSVRTMTRAWLVMALFGAGQFASAQETGSIVGWGGLVVVPQSALSDLTAVAAGWGHSLGLKANGSIVAWGWNEYGQCNVPAPNADFVAVAAGEVHSLGLKANGSIVAWGWNEYGQCNVPAPNADFVAVAAGELHSLGLKADGSIVAWGRNDHWQCNVPAPNADFIAVAAGAAHSLGLKADGSIVAWGRNDHWQCNVPAPNADFIAVAAGWDVSLGLKADGSIVAWGNNWDGQTNVPAPNTGFVGVAAGAAHSLGLKADGSIVAWGCAQSDYGQCDVPAPNAYFVALAAGAFHSLGLKADGSIVAWGRATNPPAPNADFVAVAARDEHSLGLKADGSIVAWGCAQSNYGQCDVPAPNADFVGIAAGAYHSLGLKADGSIVAWGDNSWGKCDVPAPNADFVAVAAGWGHSLGLKADGSIVAWGENWSGQCDVPAPNADFVAVAAGDLHSLGLKADGSIVAWGRNNYGQTNVPAPNSGFVAVAAGYGHSLGLKADGSIVAWGCAQSDYGQCDVPAPNAYFVALAAGAFHSLGLKADGSIVAWGDNSWGKCDVPAPNAYFVALAAGGGSSLGLKSADCNGNRVADAWDIAHGTSQDANTNGVPDECEGDLVVDAVTVEGAAIAGRPLHVAWEVHNVDPQDAVRYSFFDVVYLSADAQWDIDDIRLSSVLHDQPVAPGEGYSTEADVVLSGAVLGPCNILVRTDQGHSPEGHTGSADIFVDVEELTLGVAATDEFTDTERARYYRVTVTEGEDLRVTLDDVDNAGLNELYIRREAVPTRSQFDYRYAANFAPDQTIRIPGTAAGIYYILACADWIPPGVQASFTLLAEYLPFELTAVAPNQGGNVGRLTTKLSGAHFTPNTHARLIDSQAGSHEAIEVYFENSLAIYATFDLTSLAPGTYDVQVEDGAVRTLAAAFAVMEGGGPAFEARVVAPPAVRAFGSLFTFYVEYENQGNVDMPAPLLLLETDKPFWLDGHPEARTTILQFMAINYAGPAGILNPGTLHRVRFYSTAPTHMKLRSVTTSDVPIDWGSMYAERRPPFIDESYWEEHWQEILSQVGNTWVEYVSNLAARATLLTQETGQPHYCVEDLYLSLVESASGYPSVKFGQMAASKGTGFAPPVVTYDRPGATSAAYAYSTRVCPDGFYVMNAQAWLTAPDVYPGTPLSDFVPIDPNGYGRDCTHFASICLMYGGLAVVVDNLDFTNAGGWGTLGAYNLRDYLINSGLGESPVSINDLSDGDVIVTPNSHAMFYLSISGQHYIAEHSGAGNLNTGYPGYGIRLTGSTAGIHIKDTTDDEDDDDTDTTTSYDPNDKLSLQGWGEDGFVQGDQLMRYAVYFENLPEATGAALSVQVTDQLGAELDWTTLTLDEIAFGGTVIRVPDGLNHYEGRVEFDGWTWNAIDGWQRYDQGLPLVRLVVDIEAGIDPETGQVHWLMRCADPNTGNYPTDVYAGFLPPDQEEIAYPDPENPDLMIHPGEGYLTYSVRVMPGLPTATQIRNTAHIVFDTNDPIDTPETLNTIDSGAPTSSVTGLAAETGPLFAVTWTGQDDAGGSGIAEYHVYVSDDAEPFHLWTKTAESTAEFIGEGAHTYAFYSVAEDNVGNVEPIPTEPDGVTMVHSAAAPLADVVKKIRYLSFVPTNSGMDTALRVTFAGNPAPYAHWNGTQLWVQEPKRYCENAGQKTVPAPNSPPNYGCGSSGGIDPPWFWGATLGCDPYSTDWTQFDAVHVFNLGIIPNGVYHVQAIDSTFPLDVEQNYSVALVVTDSKWADLVKDCTTNPCGPPDNSTGIVDVTALLDKWKNLPGNVTKARADIEGSPAGDHRLPDQAVNITDVTYCLGAFLGQTYPPPGFPAPGNPPDCER